MFEVDSGRCEVRWRTLPVFVLSSPILPLPVELVAGGEGRPEDEPGLDAKGSGNLGRSGGDAVLEVEFEPSEPIKMADKGRCLCVKCGRGVIGGRGKRGKSSKT